MAPVEPNKSHGFNHSLSHSHLRWHDTGMGIRDSFSKLKKKVKHLGRKRKPDRPGGNVNAEDVGPADPLLQPEAHIVAGDGEGNETNAGGQQVSSTDQPPQPGEPELMLASGGKNGRRVGEAGVDGSEVGMRYSHPYPEVEVGTLRLTVDSNSNTQDPPLTNGQSDGDAANGFESPNDTGLDPAKRLQREPERTMEGEDLLASHYRALLSKLTAMCEKLGNGLQQDPVSLPHHALPFNPHSTGYGLERAQPTRTSDSAA